MGSTLCSPFSETGHLSLEVAASCETVWEVATDIHNYPHMNPNVLKIERLDKLDGIRVGTKWRETRLWSGRQVTVIRSITAMTDNPKSATTNVFFERENWETHRGNETNTFTLYPVDGDKCRVVFTFAFWSESLFRFLLKLCQCCLRRYAMRYLKTELDYLVKAAVKRQAKKLADKSEEAAT